MWCAQCQNELSECTCKDLQERLDRLSKSPFVHIGGEYKQKLDERAKQNKEQESTTE